MASFLQVFGPNYCGISRGFASGLTDCALIMCKAHSLSTPPPPPRIIETIFASIYIYIYIFLGGGRFLFVQSPHVFSPQSKTLVTLEHTISGIRNRGCSLPAAVPNMAASERLGKLTGLCSMNCGDWWPERRGVSKL